MASRHGVGVQNLQTAPSNFITTPEDMTPEDLQGKEESGS